MDQDCVCEVKDKITVCKFVSRSDKYFWRELKFEDWDGVKLYALVFTSYKPISVKIDFVSVLLVQKLKWQTETIELEAAG